MAKFECSVCGTIHEIDKNLSEISENWKCHICESDKSYFKPITAHL